MWMCIYVWFYAEKYFTCSKRGWARTQTPTTRNCTVELPTFAVIARVSPIWVQWKSLALGETPRWSDLLPRQVSMPIKSARNGPGLTSFKTLMVHKQTILRAMYSFSETQFSAFSWVRSRVKTKCSIDFTRKSLQTTHFHCNLTWNDQKRLKWSFL